MRGLSLLNYFSMFGGFLFSACAIGWLFLDWGSR